MQQHVSETRRNAATLEITCSNVHRAIALVTQWLHSGYNIVTLDTRSNNTDKSGRQTANAGHAQQQHRQKRQTNRQRWTRAATTQTKAADKPPTLGTRSNNTDKSGRQTANATKHMQQQHERLFVVAFAPQECVQQCVCQPSLQSLHCRNAREKFRPKKFPPCIPTVLRKTIASR